MFTNNTPMAQMSQNDSFEPVLLTSATSFHPAFVIQLGCFSKFVFLQLVVKKKRERMCTYGPNELIRLIWARFTCHCLFFDPAHVISYLSYEAYVK